MTYNVLSLEDAPHLVDLFLRKLCGHANVPTGSEGEGQLYELHSQHEATYRIIKSPRPTTLLL